MRYNAEMNYKKIDEALLNASVQKFERAYRMWFTINADPLSDDIMCDIQQQAANWAMEQALFGGIAFHQVDERTGIFQGLARH